MPFPRLRKASICWPVSHKLDTAILMAELENGFGIKDYIRKSS